MDQHMNVTLRSAVPQDEDFLRELIVQSITMDLGAQAWPESLRNQILEMQYIGRRNAYRANHPDAVSSVILVDGTNAGWVVVDASSDPIHLSEMIVLPELRGRGIATAVLRDILQTASATGQCVQLDVSSTNIVAIRLYERLGFRLVGGDPMHQRMECPPISKQ
jgi:ribosomal protein S18 acetylase RimI-like enzyme